MEDYINNLNSSYHRPLEVVKNEQKTPKRITTIYQTTGVFEDFSKEEDTSPEENNAG